MTPERGRGVLRQGLTALGGLVIISICKFVAMWMIARFMGPETQGGFSLALACTSFGGTVLSCGLDYANAYQTGRTPERLRAILAGTLVVTLGALLVAPAFVAGYGHLFPQLLAPLGERVPGALALVVAATVLTVLVQSLQAVAIGLQDYAGVARMNTLFGVVWLALAAIAAQWTFGALLAAWTITLGVVAASYGRRLAARALPPDGGAVRPVLAGQLRYGLQTVPGSVARALNLRGGLYLASAFLTPSQVGVYGVLLSISEVMLNLPTGLSQVVLGRASASRRGDSHRALRPVYALVVAVGTGITLVAAVAGRPLLSLVFGPAYAEGGPALAILCAAMTVHSVGLLRIHHVMGSGRPSAASASQAVTLVVGGGAGLLLAPRYGLVGIAAAALLAYTAFTAFLLLVRDRAAERDAAAALPATESPA